MGMRGEGLSKDYGTIFDRLGLITVHDLTLIAE